MQLQGSRRLISTGTRLLRLPTFHRYICQNPGVWEVHWISVITASLTRPSTLDRLLPLVATCLPTISSLRITRLTAGPLCLSIALCLSRGWMKSPERSRDHGGLLRQSLPAIMGASTGNQQDRTLHLDWAPDHRLGTLDHCHRRLHE